MTEEEKKARRQAAASADSHTLVAKRLLHSRKPDTQPRFYLTARGGNDS